MSNLSKDIDNLKKKYREIFFKTSEEFQKQLKKKKPKEISKYLNEEILKEIHQKWLKILKYRENFNCSGCASCCNLACSEFSYDELKHKSENGDNFATQFISVFIPYENEEEAKKVYPEYFEFLKIEAPSENVYFYHCSKITKENKCSDYKNRPQICKDFPDNPLGFLPKTCGFTRWKEEIESTALMLRSLLEITEFYKNKLNK